MSRETQAPECTPAGSHWRRGRDVNVAIHRMVTAVAFNRNYFELPACRGTAIKDEPVSPIFRYDPVKKTYFRIGNPVAKAKLHDRAEQRCREKVPLNEAGLLSTLL